MKLIIDIDEQHFEILQSAARNGMGDNSQKIIANGIPFENVLNKIRAEINKIELTGIVDEHTMFVRTAEQVKNMALDIIDKNRNEVSE